MVALNLLAFGGAVLHDGMGYVGFGGGVVDRIARLGAPLGPT